MIHFLHPQLLWLLLALPLALRFRRGAPVPAIEFSSIAVARSVARHTGQRSGRWLRFVPLLAGALMIVGLARPQWAEGHTEVSASGIDIMLGLDVSGSMQALDFRIDDERVNRIEVVKSVVARFIDERPDDRIGIVAFAGAPYLVSPLTLDHGWLAQSLQRISVASVDDGTAIGSAIATCANRLRSSHARSRIIILLTDGMNNSGKISPRAAAEAAQALGIKIYTIAVGVRGEAPIPVTDELGRTRLIMAKVDVDEKTLQTVASLTGGMFYRATDTDSLEEIYAQINQLEKTRHVTQRFEHTEELYAFALYPALVLLGLGFGLENTRYRRLP
jgi:Ca-activated chloride channel family protein